MQNKTEIKELLNEIESFRNTLQFELIYFEEKVKDTILTINSVKQLIETRLLKFNALIQDEQIKERDQKHSIQDLKKWFINHYDSFSMETYSDCDDFGSLETSSNNNSIEVTFEIDNNKVNYFFNDKLSDFKEEFLDLLTSFEEIEESVTDEG